MSRAWRSTGPRTLQGKAMSSQNARRHGLTAEPDPDIVGAWFNVILGNGPEAYEEPSSADAADHQADPEREVALRLAIAEARYHRALHALEAHPKKPQSAQAQMTAFQAEMRAHVQDMIDARCVGEARSERRKALRAWCDYNRDTNPNSRNELSASQKVKD